MQPSVNGACASSRAKACHAVEAVPLASEAAIVVRIRGGVVDTDLVSFEYRGDGCHSQDTTRIVDVQFSVRLVGMVVKQCMARRDVRTHRTVLINFGGKDQVRVAFLDEKRVLCRATEELVATDLCRLSR